MNGRPYPLRRGGPRRGVATFWVLALSGIAAAIVAASAATQTPFAVEVRRRDGAQQAVEAAEAGLLAARLQLARTPGRLEGLQDVPFGEARVSVRLVARPGAAPVLIATGQVQVADVPGPGGPLTRELRAVLGAPGPDGVPEVASWEERR